MSRPWIVTLVVGTLSIVILSYVGTLAVCALRDIAPPEKALDYLKDAGVYALGALTSLLTKTSEVPEETKIVNTPADPVQTRETP